MIRGILREDRIERIRLLRDQQRYPERYPGPFSAASLTYVALAFTASALAIGLVRALLGRWAPEMLTIAVSALAVGAAQDVVSRLWRRVKLGVISFWRAAIPAAGGVIAVYVLLTTLAPDASLARGARSAVQGAIDGQNARLDARQRARVIPVPAGEESGDGWRLLTDSAGLRMVTLSEATAWCATLGDDWAIPASFEWPDRERWPSLGRQVRVWLANGSAASIGLGGKPVSFVSGSRRATEVHGAICIQRRASDDTL